MSKIGSLDPEILAKKWSKSGQIEVSERFFEKISRNMTDTEKMMLTDIIGNFVADNIVFEQNLSSGSGDMGKKSGQNNRNANILSNMKDRQFDPKTKL